MRALPSAAPVHLMLHAQLILVASAYMVHRPVHHPPPPPALPHPPPPMISGRCTGVLQHGRCFVKQPPPPPPPSPSPVKSPPPRTPVCSNWCTKWSLMDKAGACADCTNCDGYLPPRMPPVHPAVAAGAFTAELFESAAAAGAHAARRDAEYESDRIVWLDAMPTVGGGPAPHGRC